MEKKKMKHEDTKNAVKKPLKKKNTTAITSLMMSAAFFFLSFSNVDLPDLC